MLFNTLEFILLFLPIAFVGYFLLNRWRWPKAGKTWLSLASLFFYGWWNVAYLPLLLASIGFNYGIGRAVSVQRAHRPHALSRRSVLIFGITANVLLLGYFKYAHFLVENLNLALATGITLAPIVLPLGISFFTFTQIAYLVDSYRGEAREYSFVNYVLFVTFFPHLIAGPILHHREMMPQFESVRGLVVRYRHVFLGLFIFSLGLFKKVVLADTFAIWATRGFDEPTALGFYDAWGTLLSYTFQLYFDFSGYCDMAMGAALLFNIWMPLNFNSPYKSLDIQDFWRRWHITLGRYLRDYVYIPLGGNRSSTPALYTNLMLTFLIGGIWHGASWMFVIWGALHGAALVLHRAWTRLGGRMPKALAWGVTFLFINLTWVFFRAKTMDDALRVLRGLVDLPSAGFIALADVPTRGLAWAGWLVDEMADWLPGGLIANLPCFLTLALGFAVIAQKNAVELMQGPRETLKLAVAVPVFVVAMYFMLTSTSSVFLYFNF